jgi:hypothetical protein
MAFEPAYLIFYKWNIVSGFGQFASQRLAYVVFSALYKEPSMRSMVLLVTNKSLFLAQPLRS